jgi:hypothetical protein
VTGKGYVQNANQVRAMMNASRVAEAPAKEFAQSVAHANEELAEFSINLAKINRNMEGGGGGGGGGGEGSGVVSGGQSTMYKGIGGRMVPRGHHPNMAEQPDVSGDGKLTPPGPPGTYRPQYKLSDRDLDPRVLGMIAGEASTKNPQAVDAVIDTMFNRLGSHWGSRKGRPYSDTDLLAVAAAPGQYAAFGHRATKTQQEFIRQRIIAHAMGEVPDITGGAQEYRGHNPDGSMYSGPWMQKYGWKTGVNIGGNVFAKTPYARPGPYEAYDQPHRPSPASLATSAGGVGGQSASVQLGRGQIDVRLKLDRELQMSKPKVTPGSQFDLGVNVDRTGQFFARPGDPSVPVFGHSTS